MALTAAQIAILAAAIRQAALTSSDAAVVAFATGTLAERTAMVKPFVLTQLAATQTAQSALPTLQAAATAAIGGQVTDAQVVLALFP